jgi:hypothetical protein
MKRFPPVVALVAVLALSFGPAAQAQGVPDTTAPTIDLRSPIDGSLVSQGAELTVDFSCTDDGGSGLASCSGSVPDGGLLDTSRLGPVTVRVGAMDNAGNDTSVSATVTVVDRTAPSVSLRTPADGAVYMVGEQVTADYDCADEAGGSGLASCLGPVADGQALDTSSAGTRIFTVEATDAAGNSSSASAQYQVVYESGSFLRPVFNRPAVNVRVAGAAVPIRLQAGVAGTGAIAAGWPQSARVQCGSSSAPAGGEPTVSVLKHWGADRRGRGKHRLYLWKTSRAWAGTCRQFILKLEDGSVHRADFRFVRLRRELRE